VTEVLIVTMQQWCGRQRPNAIRVSQCQVDHTCKVQIPLGGKRMPGRYALLTLLLLVGAAAPASAHEGSPQTSGDSGRVEVPEGGFAITIPEGWTVLVDTSEPPEFTERPLLTAIAPDGGPCEVSRQDATSWNSLEEWAGTVLLRLREYGPLDFASVGLPTGDAVRIDMDVPEEGRSLTQYLLTDGAGFYSLACIASEPPADRWLPIAETFEFLPVEE
jgi:hypothetical protein